VLDSTAISTFTYDNEDILLELDGSNNILARYTHGPGIDEPLVMEKSGASFFYHADGLGSVTELTDSAGLVKQRYTYSSFGKIESQLDPNFIQPYTFAAREFDPETRLYFYRARAYDPVSGRFTQQDPLRDIIFIPESLNPYLYVANNPVNFRDPFGLARCGCTPKTFGERFAKNLTETNEAFGFPVSSIRNLVTAGATARALDTVTLGRFIFSGLQRLPTGVAPAFGASPFFSTAETAILAGTTTLINAALNFAAFETGAAVGSLINAAFLQDECGESLLFRSPDDR
jgi:RHS repeat-associated protein